MTHPGLDHVEVGGDLLWLFWPTALAKKWQKRCISSLISFSFGYEKHLSLPSLSLSPYSSVGCVSSSIGSVTRSTHAALSPFQSQYFVFITADCSKGGEHINTDETCGYYVTLPSLHHTPFQPLSLFILSFLFIFTNSSVHRDITMPLFVSLPLFFFFGIRSSLHFFCMDLSVLRSPSSPSIFVSPAAGNEYLIYSLSLLSIGLRE